MKLKRWKYYKEWRYVTIDMATSGQWHEFGLKIGFGCNWFPHFTRKDESVATSTMFVLVVLWFRITIGVWV